MGNFAFKLHNPGNMFFWFNWITKLKTSKNWTGLRKGRSQGSWSKSEAPSTNDNTTTEPRCSNGVISIYTDAIIIMVLQNYIII